MSFSSNIRAGAAYVEVTAETSKLQRNLKTAQGELQSFGRSYTAIGKDMLMLSGALALPLGLAVKGFAAFDDQMRLVRAVTKATTEEFDSMTKVAQKLGRETSFTAQQVADGMTALGRMGFSPKEIEAAIKPTLDLARATGTDLGEAANIAANSMRIFGIEASKMSSVSDILTATANGSAQTLTDLFEALKMAGPQAKAAGESISDTTAAIGVLANLGIKGSLAGTALRKSFSQFANTKVQTMLKSVGVETVTANGDLRKMADIMRDISKVMATMGSAERIAFAEDIFDIRGSLAGLSLTGNVEELDAFLARLKDVEGTARTTAEEMDSGLGGSFRKLMSAVEGTMNAIGKALEETLQPLVDKLTAVTLAVIEWVEANAGMVTAFTFAVAGAAAFGVALIAIGTAAKAAAAGIAVVQTTLKAFTFLQGLCIAQGTTLGTSLSFIGQAFSNYRNLAIPALVGTEQLCAAFGIASSAANRTAASLVLMSNAEAAAAGKSILAAKWLAASNALKSFNLATIATAVSLKTQAAAEGIAALSTKVLTGARALATTVTGLFSMANIKAAATATAGGAANLFLALTTKAAAAGYIVATAAAAAFCAIPITWILIGVGAALAGVVYMLSRAGKYTAELSGKMESLRQKGDEQRQSDQVRMERLKQLSEKQQLSNAELAEAEKLTNTLTQRYGDFGASIDTAAGKLSLAADAQDRFNESMKKAAIGDLEAEISEMQANLKELKKEDEALLSYWNHNLWSQISGRQEEAVKQIEANGDKAIAYRKKMQAAQDRIKAVNGGDQNAVTGQAEDTAANVEAEKQRRSASLMEAGQLKQRFIDTEKAISRRRIEQDYERRIDATLNYDKLAGTSMLENMVEEYRAAAQAAREQFERELEAAQTDAQITDDERTRLNDAHERYTRAESLLDKYENKLHDAREGTQQTAELVKPEGSFFARALEGVTNGDAAMRTAKATEAIAINTKRTSEYLRSGISGGIFLT